MGTARPRPARLAEKLLQIRESLGLSQNELVKRMRLQDQINYVYVSKYELDKNEPPAFVMLAYARLMGIPVEILMDDKLDLPPEIRPHRI